MNAPLQMDLFTVATPVAWSPDSPSERPGWEARFLADMATAPILACPDGFTGSACERLVARGHCTAEDAGLMSWPRCGLTGTALKKAEAHWRQNPVAQRRYVITPVGRALIAREERAVA